MDEMSEYLRQQKAFKTHQPEEVAFIERLKQRQLTLPAAKLIMEEGASSTQLYTLLDGWAYRYRTLKNGNRQILNFLLPGDLIGFSRTFWKTATAACNP